MRFIQMWFIPSARDLEPSVEQKAVERPERTNLLLPIVSPQHPGALPIRSDARVYSCFLEAARSVSHLLDHGRGGYLYVVEGGGVEVNGQVVPELGAATMWDEAVVIAAERDAELLLLDVSL